VQIPSSSNQRRGNVFGADITFGKALFVDHAAGISLCSRFNWLLSIAYKNGPLKNSVLTIKVENILMTLDYKIISASLEPKN
jgi:hypothetical protein